MSDLGVNYSVDLLTRDREERNHIRHELQIVKREYGITNRKVLEVGCGLGHNLDLFREDNEVVGIEGLPGAVSQARARGLNVIHADLEDHLQISDATFDWVLCLDVFEHLVNPLGLLKEMWRVLRDDGIAIVNVPNHFDLSGRLKLLFGHTLDVHRFFPENREWDNPHLRFFTYRGMNEFVEAGDFELLQDRSSNIWNLPRKRTLEFLSLDRLAHGLARRAPSLFAGGFFLLIQKRRLSRYPASGHESAR